LSAVGPIGALVVGAAFGFVSQRGAFCMNSGMRGAVLGDWTRLKALALAVAIQIVLLPAVFASGLARATGLPLAPLAAVAGGVLFGLSMRWAGGCAAGIWYKLGAGDLGALLAVLGMALGAAASESGLVAGVRTTLQAAVPAAVPWTPPPALSAGVGLVLLALLARLGDGRAGAWSWRTTGFWVGLAATLAWPVSATAGRDFGLAVVPGTNGLLSAVAGRPFPAWDGLLVLGVAVGGWLGARRNGPVGLGAPEPGALLKRFAGGLGLGVGASIAEGCTVGQGLTGLGLLAPSGLVVMAAILGGSALATVLARRVEPGAGPVGLSSPSG
jgi:uncharacterized protein